MDREAIMQRWDMWREYIANGGKGSYPRDEFEALLDSFEDPRQKYKCPPRNWIEQLQLRITKVEKDILEAQKAAPRCNCRWLKKIMDVSTSGASWFCPLHGEQVR